MRSPQRWILALALAAPRGAAAVDLLDMAHSTSAYVAGRSDGAAHRSGTGGTTYTVQPTGGVAALNGVAYSSRFVAVGDGGRVVRSNNDGLDWSNETSNTTSNLRDVVVHGAYLVAVGDAGTTLRRLSSTAVWDTTLSPTAAALHGVASNGNILIAVGNNGRVLRSTDQGLSWSVQALAGSPALRAVATRPNSNVFVAVGLGGGIFRSTDFGLSWGSVASPTTRDLFDVTGDALRFVAVGAQGTILRSNSSDGSSWGDASPPVDADLFGVLYDGSRFFACGAREVVMRSQDGTAWLQVDVQPQSWGHVKDLYRPAAGPR